MADDDYKVKKERDPIMAVCFIVFMLTVCVITGASVYNNYVKADDSVAVNGSTVTVDYIGTYYAPYGEDGAVVFDTSRWSVANDSKVAKSNDFTLNAESNYKPLGYTVGGTTVLEDFGNAVIGYKVGDKVPVRYDQNTGRWVPTVPAGNGYNAAETEVTVNVSAPVTIPASETLTSAQYTSIYGHDLKTYEEIEESVYGWPASASFNSSDSTVTVKHQPVAGATYTMTDSDFGRVALNVTSVTGTSITYTYSVSGYTTVSTQGADKGVQMIMMDFGTEKWYIVSVTDHGTGTADTFTYKTVGERYNQDLYFDIQIVSIG